MRQNHTNELVAAVRKLRIALDDTQQDFAHRLGLAIATVVRYEHNRPPSGKALAKLEQVAAAHGLEEYAAVFRRALSDELGAPPPAPTGLTLQLKDEDERKLALALLDVLRKPFYAKQATAVKRILKPVAIKRQEDAEFSEALEASKIGVVRLLKAGHSAEEIQKRLSLPADKIAEAFFDMGGPKFFPNARVYDRVMSDVVGLLVKDGWSIRRMADTFANGEATDFVNCASQLGESSAVDEFEEEQNAEKRKR